MFELLRDRLATAQLKARYQRLVHERLLHLTQSNKEAHLERDADWKLLNQQGKADLRNSHDLGEIRETVRTNPHACQIMRILEAYVVGPGMELSHHSADPQLAESANRLWQTFLNENATHYSLQEHARRVWRDGESFLRKFSQSHSLQVRFIDPERIAATPEYPDSQGILTDPSDVETPQFYLHQQSEDGTQVNRIPAEQMLHSRIGADTNEKRGTSFFAPLIEPLQAFEKWMETELLARKLQSSIVLWRKVQGSPQSIEALTQSTEDQHTRRERIVPGTVLTTNQATDIQFLQPNTNFGDAVSLGRLLLLNIAAGAGLPEFMLTSDASNANFASTMVAEGPAVKFFQAQQQQFAKEFSRLWDWVMEDAIGRDLLPFDAKQQLRPVWNFPQLVNRDRSKERLADVRLVESGIISRAEVARREGLDPVTMKTELNSEREPDREP